MPLSREAALRLRSAISRKRRSGLPSRSGLNSSAGGGGVVSTPRVVMGVPGELLPLHLLCIDGATEDANGAVSAVALVGGALATRADAIGPAAGSGAAGGAAGAASNPAAGTGVAGGSAARTGAAGGTAHAGAAGAAADARAAIPADVAGGVAAFGAAA